MKFETPKNGTKWIRRICIIICYLFTILCLLLLFNTYINKHLKKQLISSLEDLSQQNVTLIKSKVEKNFTLLNNLAKQFGENETYDYSKSAQDTKKSAQILGFREIGIALPDGTAYMSTNTIYNISERTYFKESIKGDNYVSDILTDMRDKADVNVYSVPIKNKSGDVIAILFGISDTEDFLQSFQISTFNGKGYTYLIDSKGNVIKGSFQNQGFEMTNILKNLKEHPKQNEKAINALTNGIKNHTGCSLYFNNHGYRYGVFASLDISDWSLMTVVPESVLQERIQPIMTAIRLLCIVMFIIFLLVLIYIITRRTKTEQYLKNIAYIDSLTNLYNKVYLQDNFDYIAQKADNKKLALVIYNIRKFKMINEIYGTSIGNELLRQIGDILNKTRKYAKEIVVHDHADEFAVLYFYDEQRELEKRIQDIIEKIHIMKYSKNQIIINMAVGIYKIHDLSYSFEKIYNYAKIATNQNKNRNANSFTYYSDELGDKEIHQKRLDDSIREGIQKKEFKAWFQPKFDCHTQKIVGCEALARWYKDDGTILTPYHFIELSEKIGLIREIDELIFEDVCIKIKEWERQGLPCIPISINLSRAYLNNLNAIDHLKQLLDKYEVSSEYIQLEITESSIVDNEQQLNELISKMHRLGFKVLLDDFGTGYSSLMSINSLNFDILKIDKSFVDSIGNENGNFIIQYTVKLGRKLGMEVLVEGVENEEQYQFLKELDCDTIQGYYFSKPLPHQDFKELLQQQ